MSSLNTAARYTESLMLTSASGASCLSRTFIEPAVVMISAHQSHSKKKCCSVVHVAIVAHRQESHHDQRFNLIKQVFFLHSTDGPTILRIASISYRAKHMCIQVPLRLPLYSAWNVTSCASVAKKNEPRPIDFPLSSLDAAPRSTDNRYVSCRLGRKRSRRTPQRYRAALRAFLRRREHENLLVLCVRVFDLPHESLMLTIDLYHFMHIRAFICLCKIKETRAFFSCHFSRRSWF